MPAKDRLVFRWRNTYNALHRKLPMFHSDSEALVQELQHRECHQGHGELPEVRRCGEQVPHLEILHDLDGERQQGKLCRLDISSSAMQRKAKRKLKYLQALMSRVGCPFTPPAGTAVRPLHQVVRAIPKGHRPAMNSNTVNREVANGALL